MQNKLKKINPFVGIVAIIYVFLGILTLNNCYFWDVIQQISNEAHWYFYTNFNHLLVVPDNEYQIVSTGYHPPFMGIITAFLWKIFGYKLYVSHLFSFFWAVLLIFHTHKLLQLFFSQKSANWVFLILLLEPTVLTQFAIASPDFILLTAFVIALRGIFEKKTGMLSVGIFFVCCINMRGVFLGGMLFIANLYYNYIHLEKKNIFISFKKTILPYLPILTVLIAYYVYYFMHQGWFFANSQPGGHYEMPASFNVIIRHLFEFILRSVENGRFIIWGLALWFLFVFIRRKEKRIFYQDNRIGMMMLFFFLMTGLYFLFVFITQMPFSARYFSPQFFVLTILVASFSVQYFHKEKLKYLLGVLLFFTLTGHCWIYPEKIAKSWEGTLAHVSYYSLREECFDYLEEQNINYKDVSAGFCLYGERGQIELKNHGKNIVSVQHIDECTYFVYSNISNVEDEIVDELKSSGKWKPVKHFSKGVVFITVYQRINGLALK